MTIPRSDPLSRRRERVRLPARGTPETKLSEALTDAESIRTQPISTTPLADGQVYVGRGGVLVPETLTAPAVEGGAPGTHAAQHAEGGADDLVGQNVNVRTLKIEDIDASPTGDLLLRVIDSEMQVRNGTGISPRGLSVLEFVLRDAVGGGINGKIQGLTGDIVNFVDSAGTGRAHLRFNRADFQNIRLPQRILLTIASGVITRTQFYHTVDVEGGVAASDDLDTINGGAAGDLLLIRPENDARTVVVKHLTGNIRLNGNADLSLDEEDDCVLLHYNATLAQWWEVCRNVASAGGGGSALTVQELDASPQDTAVTLIQVPNGTLTDNGVGDVTLGYAGTAIANTFALNQTFGGGLQLSASQTIKDSGGTGRILLSTSTPHLQVTGDARFSGTVQGGGTAGGVTDGFLFQPTETIPAGLSRNALNIAPTFTQDTAGNTVRGVRGQMALRGVAGGTGSVVLGLSFEAIAANAGMGASTSCTFDRLEAVNGVVALSGSHISGGARTINVTSIAGLTLSTTVSLAGTGVNPANVTDWYSIKAQGPTSSDADLTVTNYYGLALLNMTTSRITNRLQIYEEGSGTAGDNHGNRLRSNTQIGGTTGAFGGGDGVLSISNAATVPTTSPTNAAIVYSTSGSLIGVDSGGRHATLTDHHSSITAANGNNNDVAIGTPPPRLVRFTGPTGAFTITGIASGHSGQVVYLYNTTTQNMTISHEDANSAAANRITSMTGASQATTGTGLAVLIYSSVEARWLLVGLEA